MLYDRPYMRQSGEPEPQFKSAVTTLLVITIAVFVLQQVLNVAIPGPMGQDNFFLTRWFALSGTNFQELKVWTVISYAFLHSTGTLWHIAGNMLGLFFIGRMLEPVLGRTGFLVLYFSGAIIGGLVYLAFHFTGVQPVVGASAAIFALLGFFCLLRPEQPITLLLFFVLPVTMKPKWVFRGATAISLFALLFYELPGHSQIAHSAHLGGILAGVLFFRFAYRGQSIGSGWGPATPPAVELPEWFKRRNKAKTPISYRVNRSTGQKTTTPPPLQKDGTSAKAVSRDALQKEVDRILDKINASGFGSLSEPEKNTLDSARDILSR